VAAIEADTIAQALDRAARRLAGAGIERARHEARLLLAHAAGLSAARMIADADAPLFRPAIERFEALVARRANREPVSRVTGEREFWSLGFDIDPAVLDPRPDSETLVETALALFPDAAAPLAVLDLGTGSGCLLLAVLHERPRAAGFGIDISAGALAVAARNADRLRLASRARFVRGHWGRALSGGFDLVLCNPPYVASAEIANLSPEVARFDPRLALDGGPDGLDAYREMLSDLPRLLAPDGVALVELGAGQAALVSRISAGSGLHVIGLRRDLGGIERCAVIARDGVNRNLKKRLET
jgi:release factor glutamine methyltransferase